MRIWSNIRETALASRLPCAPAMKTLSLLLVLLLAPAASPAQEPEAPEGSTIASAEVSGLDLDRLSSSLRQDISGLAGTPLRRDRLRELAVRIERERPEMIAAPRSVALPDGQARVIFLVGPVVDHDVEENVNARYTIESVDIEGVAESRLSQPLRDDLHALVGKRLSPEEGKELDKRLESELPGHDIERKMQRGSQPGQIRLVIEVREGESLRWIHFAPSRSKIVYHTDQAWSLVVEAPMGGRNTRVTLSFPIDNDDDLLEEYTGYGIRIENRRLGTERVGVSFEIARHRSNWDPATLAALEAAPRIPEAYRTRLFVEPALTFAFNRHLRASGGVSISELGSLSRSPETQMANAVIGSLGFDNRWERSSGSRHELEAAYGIRTAADWLDTDLQYTRHSGTARYRFVRGKSVASASTSLGHITGGGPLFERFSIGDTSTLRGWNKFDVAPAGGDNLVYQSAEYSYRHFAVFVDVGSVWDRDIDSRVRASTGFGFHGDNLFATVGFPLNAGEFRAAFMMGVRW